jgi:hypothetical protein
MSQNDAQIKEVSQKASKEFDRLYANFIACFDSAKFWETLGDEIRIAGLSEQTKKNFSVANLMKDTEGAALALLERGAFNSVQRFGLTTEAEEEINKLKAAVHPTQKPAGPEPTSLTRWSTLTQEQLDAMPARQSRELYKADADFRAAFDRLAAEDAAKAPSLDTTFRAYLRRKRDGFFFKEWLHGVDYWTPSFDLRAHMTYVEAKRQVDGFLSGGLVVEAFELGNHKLIDFSPKVEAPKAEKSAGEWKLQPSGLTTVGSRQRRHKPGTFLLKSQNGEFVGAIDEANRVVKTVSQSGNARAWTSRETAIAAAESIPGLPFWLYRHDGEPASS